MQKHLSELLQKEMTRKEFMATLGFGAATVMGFGSIMQLLNGHATSSSQKQSYGYGASAYGGAPKTTAPSS